MEKIQTLSLDLETFSDVDLQKCGVYKYAQSPNFEILLFGVSVNGGEVVVYDLAQGDTVSMKIVEALTDDTVTKWAYNSRESVCRCGCKGTTRHIFTATALTRIL